MTQSFSHDHEQDIKTPSSPSPLQSSKENLTFSSKKTNKQKSQRILKVIFLDRTDPSGKQITSRSWCCQSYRQTDLFEVKQ